MILASFKNASDDIVFSFNVFTATSTTRRNVPGQQSQKEKFTDVIVENP